MHRLFTMFILALLTATTAQGEGYYLTESLRRGHRCVEATSDL